MLADDTTAIEAQNGRRPMVLPGFPQLKAWPEVLSSLGEDVENLPRIHSRADKRAFRLSRGFCATRTPLQAVYLLDPGSELSIEPLSGVEALKALIPHWYACRYGIGVLRALGLSSHFEQCTRLVKEVSIYRLQRPDDVELLPAVAAAVEEHQLRGPETA